MDDDEAGRLLGQAIRGLRKKQALTLVQLAGKAELSHSFLSQLERGLARPSMTSLHRIARALGTTQQALMATDPAQPDGAESSAVSLVRASEGVPLVHGEGLARPLVRGTRPMYPVEYTGAARTFDEYWSHPGDEVIYVVAGRIEVDLGSSGTHALAPGDTLYYAGGVRHRWRQLTDEPIRLVVVQEGIDPHP